MKISATISLQRTKFEAVAPVKDLEAELARVAGWGYDGVDLAIREPSSVDPTEIAQLVGKYGLTVPAIGTGQAYVEEGLSWTDPDEGVRQRAIARIQEHVAFAKELDALVIIGLIRGEAGESELLADALSTCEATARDHGIRLVIEPINRYETTLINDVEEALKLIEAVDSEAIGVLFDTFHANIEEPSMVGSVRKTGGRLWHVHLADSNRWPPGYGHLDFAEVIGALQEIGYTDFLSIEALPKPDPATGLAHAAKYLNRLLKKIEGED
ncbi:MAG: 5-keto-L-gluconate epimerase [Candidatus Bipolaricaulia bacterium]